MTMGAISWREAWAGKTPLRDADLRGEAAAAALEGDWGRLEALMEAGEEGWLTANPSSSGDDFAALFNRPPMAHWLLDGAPWRVGPWMERMRSRHGEAAVRKELGRLGAPDPGEFGGRSALAQALLSARWDEEQSLASGAAFDWGPWLGVVGDLLRHGADPSVGDGKERSCFNYLPRSKEAARALGEALLRAGGDPRRGLERGNSFMEQAAEQGESAWVELGLLEWGLGADCGAKRPDALRWACQNKGCEALSESAFEALIQASADPLAIDLQELSPLGLLCYRPGLQPGSELEAPAQRARLERAIALMRAGADPTRAEREGKSPLEWARQTVGEGLAGGMLAWWEARVFERGAQAGQERSSRGPKAL